MQEDRVISSNLAFVKPPGGFLFTKGINMQTLGLITSLLTPCQEGRGGQRESEGGTSSVADVIEVVP